MKTMCPKTYLHTGISDTHCMNQLIYIAGAVYRIPYRIIYHCLIRQFPSTVYWCFSITLDMKQSILAFDIPYTSAV